VIEPFKGLDNEEDFEGVLLLAGRESWEGDGNEEDKDFTSSLREERGASTTKEEEEDNTELTGEEGTVVVGATSTVGTDLFTGVDNDIAEADDISTTEGFEVEITREDGRDNEEDDSKDFVLMLERSEEDGVVRMDKAVANRLARTL
jgi:hypothetical protein